MFNCKVEEGDLLYLPAFYWHEVVSYASQSFPRHNLAVSLLLVPCDWAMRSP